MFTFKKHLGQERFEMSWLRQLLQGGIIASLGLVLAAACLTNQDAVVMSARLFSWLPISGVLILAFGLLECLDGFLAEHQREFYHNLHVGILDVVVGGLILFSVGDTLARLTLLIAAFLMVRGSVRIALSYALGLPNRISTAVCGLISIVLGIMLWQQWPTDAGWFIALCLNIEIAFRGWAAMMFALWLRNQQKHAEATA